MQKSSTNIFSLLTVVSLIASVLLRFFIILLPLPAGVNIIFYVFVGACVVFSALGLKGKHDLLNAFSLKNNSRVSAMSFIAGVGFFIDFVHQCVVIFKRIDTEAYKNLIQFIPICFICLFSIISCFYFFCIAVSYKNESYDFRLLKMFNLAPLLWAVAYVLTILSTAIKPLQDANLLIKYASIIFLVCFLYFFALEIENEKSSNKFMLIFAKAFSICSFVYFVDRVFLIIINHLSAFSDDSIFAVSALLICFFVFSFEKEIIKNSNSLKGV